MACNGCKDKKPTISEKKQLGGWAIDPEVYEFILKNLPEGSTILELGSGIGTSILAKRYTMYSIEHDLKFVGRYRSNYIYAPIHDGWYNVELIQQKLPEKYDMILVDGPPAEIGRIGFWKNADLFNLDCLIVFDDTNRPKDKEVFDKILDWCNFDFGAERPVPEEKKRRTEIFEKFSVIYPSENFEN